MLVSDRTTRSRDGVAIAYSISGSADIALLFIHGGLADRSFWEGQHRAFPDRYKVVSLDLAGHGQSGLDRQTWGIPQCGEDVVAVIAAERLPAVILVGNSLGGMVALEAAARLESHVIGVIGVDTFHDLGRQIDPRVMEEQADAWRRDFEGSLEKMLRALFHPDVAPSLLHDVRRRMRSASRDIAWAMFSSFAGYDTGAIARQVRIPVRCINGDLYPTNVPATRELVADFDVVVLPHTGHFPMFECPEEFNRALTVFTAEMARARSALS